MNKIVLVYTANWMLMLRLTCLNTYLLLSLLTLSLSQPHIMTGAAAAAVANKQQVSNPTTLSQLPLPI